MPTFTQFVPLYLALLGAVVLACATSSKKITEVVALVGGSLWLHLVLRDRRN